MFQRNLRNFPRVPQGTVPILQITRTLTTLLLLLLLLLLLHLHLHLLKEYLLSPPTPATYTTYPPLRPLEAKNMLDVVFTLTLPLPFNLFGYKLIKIYYDSISFI